MSEYQILVIQAIRMINFGLAIAALALWVVWVIQNKDKWQYGVPPISWLISAFCLFGASSLGLIKGPDAEFIYQAWRSVLTIHLMSMLVGIAIILIIDKHRHPFRRG